MPSGIMRTNHETRTVARMLALYCAAHHHGPPLCESCDELLRYAHGKIERCTHGDEKPTCRRCSIHCYGPVHRERIRAVMRYAGPRMLLRHPLVVLRHAFQ